MPYKPEVKRTPEEIQRIHDLLEPLVVGDESAPKVPQEFRDKLELSLRPLCWILGHEAGNDFMEKADELQEVLRKMGYELRKPS